MSDPSSSKDDRILYLEELRVETSTETEFRVKLQMNDRNVVMSHEEQTSTWTPARSLEVNIRSNITVFIKAGHTFVGVSFRKQEAKLDLKGEEVMEAFWESRELASGTMFDGQPATVVIKLRPSPTLEATRTQLENVQKAMKKYKPLMGSSTEQKIDTFVKYGVVLAELNPMSKMAFGLVKVTFDLLKEQNKYDEMVSDLAASVERILPFAERVIEDDLYDKTELLRPLVKRVHTLIVEAATFICGYVTQSPGNRVLKSPKIMEDRKTIKDLQSDFKKLAEDFDRAVDVEALKLARKNEIDRLLGVLRPVREANYQDDRGCMEGTRTAVLDEIITWADRPPSHDTLPSRSDAEKVYWLHGMPGLGKTSIANSLCLRLRKSKSLGGCFFCRRDDPNLQNPKRVLPTLISKLAEMWSPYRTLVAQALSDDPQLNPESTSGELLLNPLYLLRKHPPRTLVLVIDAFDECGEPDTRRHLLNVLLNACGRVTWLKVVITSRPENDIKSFLETTDGVTIRDLGTADGTHEDIRLFATNRMASVAMRRHLPNDWPGEKRLDQLVKHSDGLFIFVETVSRFVNVQDPEPLLARILGGELKEANAGLHELYSIVIASLVGASMESFQLVARVIIGVAKYRPLCDKTLASLMGLKPRIVETWVDDLSSILYRDGSSEGGIRVRHLSILEFLTGPTCPSELRVDLNQAHTELSRYCLTVMTKELRFNICGLETSFLPNSDLKDLNERVQQNISDALQYSCLNWTSHLCSDLEQVNADVGRLLKKMFESERTLYWLEALSLMGKVPTGISALRQIKACNEKLDGRIQGFVTDALRFMLAFSTPISTSAPHIYISALAFMPEDSDLWHHSHKLFPKLVNVCEGRMRRWPSRPGVWLGHTEPVMSLVCSPNGLHVVSASGDNTIRIWDIETGVAVGEPLRGHTDSVRAVAYSPDGQHIVSGSSDNTIRVWDAITGAAVGEPLRGHTHLVFSVAYSPNGHHIVSGSYDNTIRVWDAITGAAVGEPLRGHTSSVTSVAYSPNGHHIVSGSSDDTIRVWDAITGAAEGEPMRGHTSWVNSVAYSPDGHHIVSGSRDHTIRVWDAITGAAVGEPLRGHTSSVASVAYSPNGHHIVSGSSDDTIRVWDAITGAAEGEPMRGHTSWVNSVAYSPDGHHIVSGSRDHTIRVWDAITGAAVGEPLRGHTSSVASVAYSPNGHHIVSGSYDDTIRVWDAITGAAVGEPLRGHTDSVTSVAYSPNGHHIVSGSSDNTIRVWDAITGAAVGEPLRGHTDSVTSVAYSPNGHHIVSGSYDNTIRVWDAITGAAVGEPLRGHTSSVTSVAYSPNGHHIVSGSSDDTIRVWDAITGAAVGEPLRRHTRSVGAVAYSPNGQHIVSGSYDHTIRVWGWRDSTRK